MNHRAIMVAFSRLISFPVYLQGIFVEIIEQVKVENLLIRKIFQLISEIVNQGNTKALFFAMQDFIICNH